MRRMIPLSSLSAGRRNPRKVHSGQQAHRRLVALIRSNGLLHPLIVRPASDDPDDGYIVIAGRRRLNALRTIYRGSQEDPKIKCEVRKVDMTTADSIALAENFASEGMHPLDEAEAFARLADTENKGVSAVAAEFGVTPRYVRQRMKLAGLADCVKTAFRSEEIDAATAEVLATVPTDRQCALWEENDGLIRNAQHAKNLIEHQWIDATHALFAIEDIPDAAVSRDLFGDRLLIERQVFMLAQAEAIGNEAKSLEDDGWAEVVIGSRDEVYDRVRGMETPGPEYDEQVMAELDGISKKRQQAEQELEGLDADDETAIDALYARLDRLDEQESAIVQQTEPKYSEGVKAVGTVFLFLYPDGQVGREYRIPKSKGRHHVNGHTRQGQGTGTVDDPPTSEDISDRQKQAAYVHETIAVRSALLGESNLAARTRRVLLVLMLSESVTASNGGVLIRREPDPIERYIDNSKDSDTPFVSKAWQALSDQRSKVDPLHGTHTIGDGAVAAYHRLHELTDEQLDRLIDFQIAQAVSGSLMHHTELVATLVRDLHVDLRAFWTPDAGWFAGYRKIQLADLIGVLKGTAHGHAAERMKKSELVEAVTRLFAKAKTGELDDPQLAEKVNRWIPSCVRTEASEATQEKVAA